MNFQAPYWRWVTVLLAAANLVGVGQAAAEAQPIHAGVHAALALGFGLWAQRLLTRPRALPVPDAQPQALDADRLDALEDGLTTLRQQLSETNERLDFAERMLTRRAEPPRLGPEHK